jgi:hypothetical protein
MTSEASESTHRRRREKDCRSDRRPANYSGSSEREIPDIDWENVYQAPETHSDDTAQSAEERESERVPNRISVTGLLTEGGQEQEREGLFVKGAGEGLEASNILIREAASLDDFYQLEKPESLESKVARGRGRGKVSADSSQPCGDDDEIALLEFQEGRLRLETDYVMHFVDENLTDLPIYDIINIPDEPCYPVSRFALDSLPGWAQAKLERKGHLKCSAVYDSYSNQFYDVRVGWEDTPQNAADALAEMLQEYDGELLARPVYYFLHQYASDEYADPETIAELRDIQESSVESEIRKASEQLDIE